MTNRMKSKRLCAVGLFGALAGVVLALTCGPAHAQTPLTYGLTKSNTGIRTSGTNPPYFGMPSFTTATLPTPSSGVGWVVYDSTDGIAKVWNGAAWVAVGGAETDPLSIHTSGGTMTGDLSMSDGNWVRYLHDVGPTTYAFSLQAQPTENWSVIFPAQGPRATSFFKTDSGGNVSFDTSTYLTTESDPIAAHKDAANTWTAAQMIDGSADAVQLTVQGHSTQTNAIQEWQASDNTVLGAFRKSPISAQWGFFSQPDSTGGNYFLALSGVTGHAMLEAGDFTAIYFGRYGQQGMALDAYANAYHASGSAFSDGGGLTIGNAMYDPPTAFHGRLMVHGADAVEHHGVVNFGATASNFDGSTSGHFMGSTSGTILAINDAAASARNPLDIQVGGVSKFKVDPDGRATARAYLTPFTVDATFQVGMVGEVDATHATCTGDCLEPATVGTDKPSGVYVGTGAATASASTEYTFCMGGKAYVAMDEDAADVALNDLIYATNTGSNAGYCLGSATVAVANHNAEVGHSLYAEAKNVIVSLDDAADTLTLTSDPTAWAVGDPVIYWNSGDTTVTGLADGGVYWIQGKTGAVVSLALTKGGAKAPISAGTFAAGAYLQRLPKCLIHWN